MAAYSRRVVQVEMGFLQRLAVVALWIRKTEQSLFEEVAGPMLDITGSQQRHARTLSRSRRKRQRSADRASRKHRRCRLRPNGRRESVPCRA